VKKEEFISSGLLELYVLGALSSDELALVNDMLSTYPELLDEVKRIEKDAITFAEQQSPKPSNGLKSNILSAIDALEVKSGETAENTGAASVRSITPKTESSSSNFGMWLMMAASVALLVVSLVFNYLQYQDINKANAVIAELNEERSIMANNLDTYKTSFEVASNKLSILRDTATVTIPMKGVELSPNSLALIHWNKNTNETYIDIASLPEPPTEMQYQLWAIVDGQPVDLGVFDVLDNSIAMQQMKTIDNPQAFAVTLEKVGGNPTPTLEQMYVLGTV
jgi:anti-sigma-K factor RskA